jgi:hypothetical protein
MASISSLIPTRVNGQTIFAAWFNTIRSVLETLNGAEATTLTAFSGIASQTGANVTDLVFSSASTRRADVEYVIVTATKVESGSFVLLYDGTNWTFYGGSVQGVDSLISLDVNSGTGQVEYDSDAETFTLNYKTTTFNI